MEIEGYPNYLIYDDGRIWSIPRNGRAGRFLTHTLLQIGYYKISLTHTCGSPNIHYIHRLLANHYIRNPENKPQVDHIDRNRTNNRLSNLRWATSLEQSTNKGMRSDNSSGHEHISPIYSRSRKLYWEYTRQRLGHKTIRKSSKNKIDIICFKYICLLKIQAGIV